jgi:hypothetical protein
MGRPIAAPPRPDALARAVSARRAPLTCARLRQRSGCGLLSAARILATAGLDYSGPIPMDESDQCPRFCAFRPPAAEASD